MKRAIAILLALLMVLSLAACGGGNNTPDTPADNSSSTTGKSENVLNVETLIDAIGEVTVKSEDTIALAEKEYGYLTDTEKEEVSNRTILLRARDAYDEVVYQYLLGVWKNETSSYNYAFELLDGNSFRYTDDYYGHSRNLYGDWSYADGKVTFEFDSILGFEDKRTYSVIFDNDTMVGIDGGGSTLTKQS